MSRPTVVDLSHHNPEPDWAKLKAGGVLGIILKATESTTYIDPTFQGRRERAKAAGLPVISYHFLKHGSASQQMLHYLDVVAPQKGERVVIDYEDPACTLADLIEAVSALIAAGLNLQITIYGGGLLKRHLGDSHNDLLATTSLWLAQYGPTPKWPQATWPVWSLWQYTDAATVAGIAGPVDGNVFNGSDENLMNWLQPTAPMAVEPKPAPALAPVQIDITVPAGVTLDIFVNGEQIA